MGEQSTSLTSILYLGAQRGNKALSKLQYNTVPTDKKIGAKKVRKQSMLLVAVFVCLVLLTVSYVSAAGSAVKPTVTLPSSDWTLKTDTAYPNSRAEHDPQGAGLLEYQNTVNYDFVMVYYEKAVDAQPSQSSLQADAEHIFARDHTDATMSSSGIMTIAGVQAGYAKGYDFSVGTYGVVRLEA